MSNYLSKEKVTHLMWAFLIPEQEESLRRKKAVQGLLWEWTGSVVRDTGISISKLRRILIVFQRERLFFISCPVSQIIFKTRAKSSTDRAELLPPAAMLSTFSIRTVRSSRHSAPLGKKPQIFSALNLLVSSGQDWGNWWDEGPWAGYIWSSTAHDLCWNEMQVW